MIREQRHWVSGRWRFLFLVPALLAALGLYAISGRPQELLAGIAPLGLLLYGMLIFAFGRTRVDIDAQGFRLTPGPLPAFVRREQHTIADIVHLFPRYVRESVGRNAWEDRYYAAVELRDGRWLNVRGHYPDWAAASASCLELARLWQLPEVAGGRRGFPPHRDWTQTSTVIWWGVLSIAALLWGLAVELLRSPIRYSP
ncbi:MAG: hypothetical protein K2Q23_09325 [Bryobacteraceae bacterium]|nr:hypothetical protein [Bryobacteraceae bacterium]